MAITITDQAFATIWAIPYYEDNSSGDRFSSIAGVSDDMLKALSSAVGNVAIRTTQLRRAAKLAIGLETLLEAYQQDPGAFSRNAVSTARPRSDEVEAQVRAGAGPKADTIAKAVAFQKATGQPCPTRDEISHAAEYMAARSLMEDREARLIPVLMQ